MMKDINDCANFDEIEVEYRKGVERYKELSALVKERIANGDTRMSYTGLKEILEGMELNQFILDETNRAEGLM